MHSRGVTKTTTQRRARRWCSAFRRCRDGRFAQPGEMLSASVVRMLMHAVALLIMQITLSGSDASPGRLLGPSVFRDSGRARCAGRALPTCEGGLGTHATHVAGSHLSPVDLSRGPAASGKILAFSTSPGTPSCGVHSAFALRGGGKNRDQERRRSKSGPKSPSG